MSDYWLLSSRLTKVRIVDLDQWLQVILRVLGCRMDLIDSHEVHRRLG